MGVAYWDGQRLFAEFFTVFYLLHGKVMQQAI